MSTQIEELIKEIALKHSIAISPDDPIMVLQTINNRLIQDGLKAQQAQLDKYKEDLEGVTLRWESGATTLAERILNAALVGSKNAMAEMLESSTKEISSSTRKEIDAALANATAQISDAQKIGILNIAASCISLIAVAALVILSILH